MIKLYEYVDKKIKVTLVEGDIIIGKCIDYTKAVNNDPEIDSIDLKIKKDIYELYENEIESIEIVE